MDTQDSYPTAWAYEKACAALDKAKAEVISLRDANKCLSEILDDVLPTLVIKDRSFLKVDGHWIRVIITSPTDDRPLQAEVKLLT